ncbi:MAG TPA: hypothetical protein VM122_10120 [Usitatibacter sp.]|nr:hypothetical protein [Usitatibacter sp.]
MTNTPLRNSASQLRREELRRIAVAVHVEWSTLIHKIAAAISSGRRQWHAHARNLHLD